jgi:hypothetical protein
MSRFFNPFRETGIHRRFYHVNQRKSPASYPLSAQTARTRFEHNRVEQFLTEDGAVLTEEKVQTLAMSWPT